MSLNGYRHHLPLIPVTLTYLQPSKPFMTPQFPPMQWLDAIIDSVSGSTLEFFFTGVVASVAVLIPSSSEAAENV